VRAAEVSKAHSADTKRALLLLRHRMHWLSDSAPRTEKAEEVGERYPARPAKGHRVEVPARFVYAEAVGREVVCTPHLPSPVSSRSSVAAVPAAARTLAVHLPSYTDAEPAEHSHQQGERDYWKLAHGSHCLFPANGYGVPALYQGSRWR